MSARRDTFAAAARRAALAVVIAAAPACATRPARLQAEPAREWPAAQRAALDAVQGGRYTDADLLLAGFARRYRGSDEAHEGLYWRALFRLDPQNRDANPADALAAVDEYLTAAGASARPEMVVLRRVAVRLAAGRDAARRESTSSKADEEELNRVRQELKTTQEELERIKRRLTNPKP